MSFKKEFPVFVLSLVCGLVSSAPAYADTAATKVLWNSIGSGCNLETGASTIANLNATFGTASFQTSSTGTYRMTCPITAFHAATQGATTYSLYVTFQDQDATFNNCRIQAHLLRTSTDSSGSGNTIASFDSNSFSGGLRDYHGVAIPETFDFNASYYWVLITMNRNSACLSFGYNPTLFGVQIRRD